MRRLFLLLGLLPGSLALVYEAGVRGRPARRASRSRVPTASLSSWEMSDGGVLMQSTAAGGGIMVDGQRLGPPPDMPSLLLSNRIVYLGMPIAAQVAQGGSAVPPRSHSDRLVVDDTCGDPSREVERASRPRLHARRTPNQVTELIISELLYLQNESQEKPVLMYADTHAPGPA